MQHGYRGQKLRPLDVVTHMPKCTAAAQHDNLGNKRSLLLFFFVVVVVFSKEKSFYRMMKAEDSTGAES